MFWKNESQAEWTEQESFFIIYFTRFSVIISKSNKTVS